MVVGNAGIAAAAQGRHAIIINVAHRLSPSGKRLRGSSGRSLAHA